MDKALKARKLGSATTRRQRIQEREGQQYLVNQVYMGDNEQTMPDTRSSNDSAKDSALGTAQHDVLKSSVEKASDSSAPTAEVILALHDPTLPSSPVQMGATDTATAQKEDQETHKFVLKTQSRPKMQATLTTMADWNYDRFSILIDSFEVEEVLADLVEDEPLPSSDEEDLEEDSPIEIATPILFTMPKMKPSVVSITHFQSQSPPLQNNVVAVRPPMSRRHVSEQLFFASPQESVKSPGELFQYSNSSRDTFATTTDSSQVSRSVSLASQNNSTISRSVSQTSQSDQSEKSPKRKSSLPLLFGGNKNGHSRMSSIKKFIRSSTLGGPHSNQSYGALQRQPSSAALETHFESRHSSMDVSRSSVVEQPKRPTTARAPTPPLVLTDDITALPMPLRTPILTDADKILPIQSPEPLPMKPVSKFRSRSGSFGHALKSGHTEPNSSEASMPPVPKISIPSPRTDLDTDSSLLPPPLTPRHPRRSVASYSPFPTTDKRVSSMNVGLGLQY